VCVSVFTEWTGGSVTGAWIALNLSSLLLGGTNFSDPVSFLVKKRMPGIVVHAYNPSIHEAEAGVQDQPGLHS
jgi:hypothetical protein